MSEIPLLEMQIVTKETCPYTCKCSFYHLRPGNNLGASDLRAKIDMHKILVCETGDSAGCPVRDTLAALRPHVDSSYNIQFA